MTTTHALSLGPLVLLGTQHGPMVTVSFVSQAFPVEPQEFAITIPEWTALVALVDSLAVADREMGRLRAEIRKLRHGSAAQMALTGGFVRCENPVCLASIDLPLIADSKWAPDARGWWFCPTHKEQP